MEGGLSVVRLGEPDPHASKQLPANHPSTPHVNWEAVPHLQHDLRCPIRLCDRSWGFTSLQQGATSVAAEASLDQLATPTEIGHLEDRDLPEAAADEQVCRLDVPMHNAMVVHVGEPSQ